MPERSADGRAGGSPEEEQGVTVSEQRKQLRTRAEDLTATLLGLELQNAYPGHLGSAGNERRWDRAYHGTRRERRAVARRLRALTVRRSLEGSILEEVAPRIAEFL